MIFFAYGDVAKSSGDVQRKVNKRDVENNKKMSATEKLKDDQEQAIGIENPVTSYDFVGHIILYLQFYCS